MEVVLDLSALDATTVRALPSPIVADRVVYRERSDNGWDIRVATTDGAEDVLVVGDWKIRGGVETFIIDSTEGVAWSPDGDELAYADEGGVYVADLSDLGDITHTFVHADPGAVSISPGGDELVVLDATGPAWDRKVDVYVYQKPWGGSPVNVIPHLPRWGDFSWSADGTQFAVNHPAEFSSTKSDVAVYTPPVDTDDDGNLIPTFITDTWTDILGSGNITTTHETQQSWALDVSSW